MKVKFNKQLINKYSDEIFCALMQYLIDNYNTNSFLEISPSGLEDHDIIIEEYKDGQYISKHFLSIRDEFIKNLIPNEDCELNPEEYIYYRNIEESIEFYKDMEDRYEDF